MKKLTTLLFAAFVAILSLPAHAQVAAGVGVKPAYVAPNYQMLPGKVYVDVSKLPQPRPAFKDVRITEICTMPDCNPSTIANNYEADFNSGSFRIGCSLSHVAFDDPLVFPGQSGKTHGHIFFGNTKTRAATDVSNMAASGDSTCTGGILNRTGYWAPFFVYECPSDTAVARGCDASRHGEPIIGTAMNFYYKNSGAISSDTTIWPPAGLRFISGKANATTPDDFDGQYQCYRRDGQNPVGFGPNIPTPAQALAVSGCEKIDMIVGMQQCWDGVNLSSPDHQSHMRRRPFYQTCAQAFPTTHPVTIPDIALNIFFPVKNDADLAFWRLTSDPSYTSGQPAGWTAHADWVDGWDRTPNLMGWGSGNITDIIMFQCGGKGRPLVNGGRGTHNDCHNHILGTPNPAKPNTHYTVY